MDQRSIKKKVKENILKKPTVPNVIFHNQTNLEQMVSPDHVHDKIDVITRT